MYNKKRTLKKSRNKVDTNNNKIVYIACIRIVMSTCYIDIIGHVIMCR